MRNLALTLGLLLLASPVLAQDKPTDHIGTRPEYDTRDGGETIEDAIPVELPFFDTGATCDNLDDYDEVCPYDFSTSPDVVYTFTPQYEEYFDIDLAGSGYDTKVYVYDSNLELVACNDDFYSDYTSKIESFHALAGETYYLVIDGYGGDCGWYQIFTSCMPPPCIDAQCHDGSLFEGEPTPGLGYVDNYNGGCDSDPPVFQDLQLPPGQDDLDFCGYTGWYHRDGVTHRDSDWYILQAAGSSIQIGAESAHFLPVDVDVINMTDCPPFSTLPNQAGICEVGEIEIATQPGELVFVRVRPHNLIREGCAPPYDLYTLWVAGIQGVVATDHEPWGLLKSYYR